MADTVRAALVAFAGISTFALSQNVSAQEAEADQVTVVEDSAEMAAIFEADQAARRSTDIDWNVVSRQDAERKRRTREMLNAGELRTGNDFWAAAFIFQHGGLAQDYLLAHVLAVHAVSLGSERARWIAAATLDRYLQSTGASQIYGTQYRSSPGQPATMEPYNQDLLTDRLREGARVPSLAEQEERRAEIEAMVSAAASGNPGVD